MPDKYCTLCDAAGGNEFIRFSKLFDDETQCLCDTCWTSRAGNPFSLSELAEAADRADTISDDLLGLWVTTWDSLTPSPVFSERDLLELRYDGRIPGRRY